MDIQAISTAIINSLSGLDLHLYDYADDSPNSPAAYITSEGTYGVDFHSRNEAKFTIRFLVASTQAKGGQAHVNTLLSTGVTGSAIDKLRTDNTFSNAINSSRVTAWQKTGALDIGGIRYYCGEVVLEVLV